MTPSDRPLFAAPDSDAATLVREPQQARSRRTLARILGASLELLRAEGPDALTVTRITKKAKSSVGSFYARFEGKEDLVRYIGEQALAEASRAWDEAREALGSRPTSADACDTLVRALADILLEGPGRPLVLLDGLEESERSRLRRLEDDVASGLRSFARDDVSARVAAMASTSVLSQAAQDLEGQDRSRLLDELVRLVIGYFEAGDSEDRAPSPEPEAEEVPDRTRPGAPGGEPETGPESESGAAASGKRPGDDIDDMEGALRDLGAELGVEEESAAEQKAPASQSAEPTRDAEDVGDGDEEASEPEPPEADPFDVWG